LGHGSYTEIKQDEFLPTVTKSKYCICHFYHPDFERCKIIDKHLSILSKEHVSTKFVKINSDKSPFFVEKLVIQVLPTLIFFKDGVAIDRMVGFDDVGGKDDFPTRVIQKRIAKSGVITLPTEETEKKHSTSIRTAYNKKDAVEDEDD